MPVARVAEREGAVQPRVRGAMPTAAAGASAPVVSAFASRSSPMLVGSRLSSTAAAAARTANAGGAGPVSMAARRR